MTEKSNVRSNMAVMAAIAWVVFPIAWGLAAAFENDSGESSIGPFGVIGWIALVGGGVLLLVAIRPAEETAGNLSRFRAGTVVHSLAILVSLVFFWAVFLWAVLYAIAMVLYATAAPEIRRATALIAGAMAAGVAAFFVLTVLEVGSPDSYGDYPAAWITANLLAALGAGLGSFVLSTRQLDTTERVAASV